MAQERATLRKPAAADRRPPRPALQFHSAAAARPVRSGVSVSATLAATKIASVAVSAPVSVQCARAPPPPRKPQAVKPVGENKKNGIVQRAEAAVRPTTPAAAVARIARSPPPAAAPVARAAARPARVVAPLRVSARPATSPAFVSASAPVSIQCARISSPNDPAEQEAKQTARKVVEMAAPAKPSSVKTTGEGSQAATVVRRAEARSASAASAPSPISLSGGRPLPTPVRSFMEPRFGASFGSVRIHTGEGTAQQSAALNAHAFTVSNHVFFGRNQFQPDTTSGRELIAHELTHVLQQSGSQAVGGVARTTATEPGTIQREEGSSSPLAWLGQKVADLVDFGEAAGWSLLERFAPDLVPIVRGGPGAIIDWIKAKAEAAAEVALNAIAAPVRAVGGAGDRLAARFAPLAATIQQAAAQIARNDCTPLREAAAKIEATATALIQPIVEFLQPIVAKVKGFLDDAWDLIGAPMWEWIKRRAAEQWAAIQWLWDKIKAVASWIWKNTETLRTLVGKAWTWFKNKLGIGEGPEGENGLLQWVQAKVEAAWDAIKVKLEPYRKQIMAVALAVGGVLLMVSPAGPIVAVGAIVAGAVQGLRWIQANWGKGDAIVRARQYLEQTLIPTLTSALERVMAAVSRVAGALAGTLSSIAAGMAHAAAAIQNSVLKLAAGVVQWLAGQAQALSNWAAGGLASLNASLKAALSRLHAFLNRMLAFLGAVGRAVVDVWKVPALVVGQIWDLIPACIRDPVVDFLGRLILNQIELFQELARDNDAWQKTKKDVANIIKLVFTDGDLKGALLATFDLILRVFNIDKDLLVQIKAKALAAWDIVVKKPLAFIKNLVLSIGAGFRLLGKNILSHLEFGLKEWLLGPLKDENITPPTDWKDPRQLFNFALDIMGINVENVFKLIGDRIGTDKAGRLKVWFRRIVRAVELVSELIDVNKSPAENTKGIIDKAKDFGATILTGMAEWVAGKVAAEITKMAVAAAASAGLSEVLDIARRIYIALVTAKRYARRVLEMVNQALDNVLLIAGGNVDAVGTKIEEILHRGMPVVIGFLADQVGLGGITQAIRDTIKGLRAKVDDALRWVINKVADALEALVGAVKAGVAALLEWWRTKVPIGNKAEPHTLQFDGNAENSSLRVHSNGGVAVPVFVERFRPKAGAAAKITEANKLGADIDGLLEKYRNEKKSGKKDADKNADKIAAEITQKTEALGKLLTSLLGSGVEGSKENPVPFDYPKRAAHKYPDIYTGPRTNVRVNQDWLRAAYGKSNADARKSLIASGLKPGDIPDDWKSPVKRYGATTQTTLDDDSAQIGLSAEILKLDRGAMLVCDKLGTTGGGGKINRRFRPFGFRAAIEGGEGMDGDHVMERQLGGPDELFNLWPLNASENRSSGSRISSLQLAVGGKSMTVKEARDLRGSEPLHLLISNVLPG